MTNPPEDVARSRNKNLALQQKYTASASRQAARYRKRIPYLIGLIILILGLSYVNTFEGARPFTMPVLMALMVILLVFSTIQDGNVAKSYHDQNIAMKLQRTGREEVGIIRSILWRPLILLTLVILIGLVALYWVSGGAILTLPPASP